MNLKIVNMIDDQLGRLEKDNIVLEGKFIRVYPPNYIFQKADFKTTKGKVLKRVYLNDLTIRYPDESYTINTRDTMRIVLDRKDFEDPKLPVRYVMKISILHQAKKVNKNTKLILSG